MAAGSMGHQAKLATEPGASPHTFDIASEPFEFISESLRKSTEILGTNGIRGTRSHHVSRTRQGLNRVGGSIRMNVSPADLEIWLPRIMGSASVGVLAETLPAFGVMIDRVAKVFTYSDCYVSRAAFTGSAGGLIEMALDIVGRSESVGNAGTFPVLTLGITADDDPYVFHDGTVSLAGGSEEVFDWELVVDNAMEARFVNAQNATAVNSNDRIVTFGCTVPYTTDEVALYDANTDGAIALVTLTNGNVSTAFSMAGWQPAPESPVVDQRNGEIRLRLSGQCRMSGTTRELVVTNDAIP